MTTLLPGAAGTPDTAAGSWDEPEGIPPRGTVIVLTGRGESAWSYGRFGRRLAADAYRVRVVETDLDDLAETRRQVEHLLADETLPSPKVLAGSDSGATAAALLIGEVDADAAILAGLAFPDSATVAAAGGWEAELEARTGCPTHRRVISEDDAFERGALARPLPWESVTLHAPGKPVLVIHGEADPITPSAEAFGPYRGAEATELLLVVGGRHDVLNDLTHRSVAASVVLFLERLKLGAGLPQIVRPG